MKQPLFHLAPVTKIFLALFFIAWIVTDFVVPDPDIIINQFAFVPAEFPHNFYTLITYQFLHGGILHLLMNAAMFAALGNAIEGALSRAPCGKARFVAFTLLCGIIAALGEWALHPNSEAVFVGASGAVSGLLGALLFLQYQRDKIRRTFLLQIIVLTLMMAAIGIFNLVDAGAPIAWVAHIAGFLGGIALWKFISTFRAS